jgi:heme a synthase
LKLTIVSLLTFLLVGFQGWIGSFVVSTNLTPWTVTVHMFLALLIVALLVWLVHQTYYSEMITRSRGSFWLTTACIVVLLIQILLGTEVREAIDGVSATTARSNWILTIENTFFKHRSFSWIVLFLHVVLILNLRKTQGLKPFPLTVILLILGTILSGAGMGYFGVPAWLQPVHLTLATETFGMLFLLLLKLTGNNIPETGKLR